jgi:hypothetical protein
MSLELFAVSTLNVLMMILKEICKSVKDKQRTLDISRKFKVYLYISSLYAVVNEVVLNLYTWHCFPSLRDVIEQVELSGSYRTLISYIYTHTY